MMPVYEERLSDHLLLRTVRDERDIDRFAAFNTLVNDATQGRTCANLLRHHPAITPDLFLFVEDEQSNAIVATVCLIPWTCHFAGIPMQAAMLEMVATHPAYRQRGLVRTLIKHFHQLVDQHHFDFCIIEGIPYYYRQFGYGYAGDHWRYDALPVGRIPAATSAPHYHFRQATVTDIPALVPLYDRTMADVSIATVRDATYWHFLLTQEQYPVEVIEDPQTGQFVGYICTLTNADQQCRRVIESSIADADVAWAVLHRLKATTTGEIHIGWPESNTLVRLARTLGSTVAPPDQWLIRLPDVARFLMRVGPVLERRLANSMYASLTADLTINLFRQAFRLSFVKGQVQYVAALGFVDASMGADGGDLCIPPDAFVRLLFGYRTLADLGDAWPDIVIKPAKRHLFNTLFPKESSYLWMPYLYFGP